MTPQDGTSATSGSKFRGFPSVLCEDLHTEQIESGLTPRSHKGPRGKVLRGDGVLFSRMSCEPDFKSRFDIWSSRMTCPHWRRSMISSIWFRFVVDIDTQRWGYIAKMRLHRYMPRRGNGVILPVKTQTQFQQDCDQVLVSQVLGQCTLRNYTPIISDELTKYLVLQMDT